VSGLSPTLTRSLGAVRRPLAGDLALLAAIVGLAVIVAASAPEFRVLQLTNWTLFGLLALSLTLVWGQAGIFSFGQAAFFGIGGYAYGSASINFITHTGETVTAVAVAAAIAAAAAALLGYFMFYGNLGDVYVAIVTLATTLVLFTFFSSTASPSYHIGSALLGGYNGMVGVPPIGYRNSLPLTTQQFLVVTVAVAAGIAVGLRVLLRRSFGRIAVAMRENEERTQLLGYDIRARKLLVFTLGGAIAGIAGAGYAAWGQFVNPAVFGLEQAALVVIWVLVGGRRSLLGAFAGVFLIQWLTTSVATSGSLTPFILGGVLILIVLFLPRGLVPTVLDWLGGRVPAHWTRATAAAAPGGATFESAVVVNGQEGGESALEAHHLRRSFGGVAALRDVSLVFPPKGLHCLIGPNGAGKTTFFNLLVGRFLPSSGRILLGGDEITRRRPDQRARKGIGIKLQIGSIYGELSCFENMWLAAYAGTRDNTAAVERSVTLLEWLGLRARAAEPAGILSHGEQQWLEIGMVLAAQPRVVLLDEPTAGMSREETARTAELLRSLGQYVSVVVVEHDMEFVRRLDVPVTVFHQGEIFAQGSLAELRRDERVLDIYLGRRDRAET
jgi:branched-chain amino acid transport system permease protein